MERSTTNKRGKWWSPVSKEFMNINEMSDSRELLEAKPNPIIPLFIYLLITILVIAFMWTYFGEMDEVVKANGVIRTNETESTIRNQMSDEVHSINFFEGQHVKEGDTLFTLNQSDNELQETQIKNDLSKLETKLVDIDVLEKSVNQEENLFVEDNEFSERYTSYITSLSLMELELEGSKIEVSQNIEEQQKQKKGITSQREKTEREVKQLEKLKVVISKKENTFGEKEIPYYNQAADVVMTIKRMEKEIKEAKEDYEEIKSLVNNNENEVDESNENTLEESNYSHNEVNESKRIYEDAELKLEQYTNQQLLQIDNDIIQEKDQLDEMQITLDSVKDHSQREDNQAESYQSSLKKSKSDMLVQINNDVETYVQQIEQLEKELAILEKRMEDSIIKAPTEGIVNVRTKVSVGDLLQAGTEVLTIVPETNASTYKVQLSVSNQDITNTKVGDQVSFSVHSLPYQEYGKIHGEITKISTDAIQDPETGLSYYLAEATINNDILYSYNNKESNIKVGMTTDAHIITDSKKILHFLLEKIDLKN